MQGMPPFLTMRVDDETGNFEWIHIANEFGIKPWVGLFIDSIDDAEAADSSALTNAGLATAAIHAFRWTRPQPAGMGACCFFLVGAPQSDRSRPGAHA